MSEPGAFTVRCVVAGLDDAGQPAFLSDGPPLRTVGAPNGFGVSELAWFERPPRTAADGGDPPADRIGAFPAAGGIAARLIRFAAPDEGASPDESWVRVASEDPSRPGMHRSETLDLMIVLDGRVLLGLDDGEHEVGPGVAVIQRGTVHRWRVLGAQPLTFLSVLVGPAPGALPNPLTPRVGGGTASGHRLVTGTHPDGRSTRIDAGPPVELGTPDVTLRDLWQTGGPVHSTDQGGDADGPWALEPAGRGISLRTVQFAPGHDPGAAGMHATETIDVDLLLAGSLELALPGRGGAISETTVLHRGDTVLMRGVTHRWRPVGDEPAVLASVMIGLP